MSVSIDVEYDAGYFDKDEQGWCAHVHRIRSEGELVHVHERGDRAGLDPFERRWTARMEAVDEPSQIVVLAREGERRVFDLRTQRLLSSEVYAEEAGTLAIPPCGETMEPFVRWALASLARLTDTALVTGSIEPLGTRGSATDSGIRRGEVVVARISRFDQAGALIGLDVSVHAITLEWRDVPTLHPRTFRVRRHLPSLELAQLRTRLRTLEAPCLVRPSLLRRLLTDEAREVGSRLSELDHGGGAAAWERIAKAGAIARAAITALPEVRAASGLADLDAFASNPSSGWSALDRPAPLEPAPHIDACSVLALAARAPELARALAATALASLPRDHPLVGPLSALRDTGDEASLHRIAETVDPPRRGEGLHVGRRLADPV